MPYINVKLNAKESDELRKRVVNIVMDNTTNILNKKADVTSILVEFVSQKSWSVGEKNCATFYLDIKITKGTNTKEQKSNYIKNVMKKLSVIVCLFMFALMPLLAQVKQTVAVLGDSYSTFEGFIPKGYATWYTTAVQKATDVNKVEQTWWWQVIKEGGYKMGNINSYSGSTICNTGYRDEDYSDRSFINRTTLLGNPDIILICGGTNDSWANAPIGNYQYSNWKRADLY